MNANYTTPSPNEKVLTDAGRFSLSWWKYLTGLSPASVPPDTSITVGVSPFSYTAQANGAVIVSGGTVSGIALKRTGAAYALGAVTQITVGRGDVVTVTYSVAPTMALFSR